MGRSAQIKGLGGRGSLNFDGFVPTGGTKPKQEQATPMVDFRARIVWAFWCVVIAAATAVWISATFDATGHPPTELTASLWASPAALVLLVVWWRGVRGFAVAALAVAAGAWLHAELSSSPDFDLRTFAVVGAAMVVGYGAAGASLRVAAADLRRPGLRDVVRFVAIAVVLAPLLVGATVGTYLTRDASLHDHLVATRALATIDMSAIVVVVPIAFVLRDLATRRRARRADRGCRIVAVRTAVPAVGGAVAIAVGIVAVSLGGVRVDVLVGVGLALVLAAVAEERRRDESIARDAAAELALGRAHLDSLMDVVPDGVLVLDAVGRVVRANELAGRLFGAEAEALAGRSLLDLVPPPEGIDPSEHLVEALSSRRDAAGSVARTWDARTVDGQAFSLDLSVARTGGARRWGYLATIRENTDRRRREQQLAHRTTHDDLTQLPNRVLFQDRLEQALGGLRTKQTGLALLLVDVDRHEIDRLLGGLTGDLVFAEAAARVRDCVRPSDTVARVGDDEIAILCTPCPNPAVATDLARRVIERLSVPHDRLPVGVAPHTHVGVVTTDDPEARPDHLLAAADAALERARNGSVERWATYEPTIDVRESPTVVIAGDGRSEIDLRESFTPEHVVVRYQPILDLATGSATSIEALARLRGDDGALLAPDQFVPQAERGGLVERLSAVVLPRALNDLAVVRNEEHSPDLSVAVNIAPAQLTPTTVEVVRDCLRDASLPGTALMLEITETAPIHATEETLDIVRALRTMGVGIAFDDFGRGYSRLDLIRELPLDALKVDRSFVQDLSESAVDRDIVEMVVAIGRRRGLMVIAEGVETIEQVDAITGVGCTHAQGYLFGQPMDLDELRYLLREWQIVPAIAAHRVVPLKDR